MGNRGKWNAAGATRRLNNGSSAKRTLLGRIKNRAGDFLFGTRQNRKLLGKLKNSLEAFIEERIPGLGVTKSRQREKTTKEINAAWDKVRRLAKQAKRHRRESERAGKARSLPLLLRTLMFATLLGQAARPPPPPEPMLFTVPALNDTAPPSSALSFGTARSGNNNRSPPSSALSFYTANSGSNNDSHLAAAAFGLPPPPAPVHRPKGLRYALPP